MSGGTTTPEGATPPGSVTLMLAGQSLVLHPQRAVQWVERRTLIVADTHFGKSGMLGRHGLAVPAGSDAEDRRRLQELARKVDATRLIVLGDFLHAPLDAGSIDAAELEAWCAELRGTEIHVVAGNHDRGALRRWRPPVIWLEEPLIDGPFCFIHDAAAAPKALPARTCFTMSGHVHPVVRLRGLSKRAPRIPVFWQRPGGLVLPSFGGFTGGHAVTLRAGERVFAIAPDRVVPFPRGRSGAFASPPESV